jgi:uncharacterized protein (DUF486 family)
MVLTTYCEQLLLTLKLPAHMLTMLSPVVVTTALTWACALLKYQLVLSSVKFGITGNGQEVCSRDNRKNY